MIPYMSNVVAAACRVTVYMFNTVFDVVAVKYMSDTVVVVSLGTTMFNAIIGVSPYGACLMWLSMCRGTVQCATWLPVRCGTVHAQRSLPMWSR